MSPDRAGPSEAPRPGRDGELCLRFERRGEGTALTARRFTLPLQALDAMDLDATGAATVMLLNPTGGIVGGDRLDTSVTLGPGSRVCLTTPSATRVYRSTGATARHRFCADVGAGARLEYVPDHLIPSPGARLQQVTDIMLRAGAELVLADGWAAGRVARGERWEFDRLELELSIRDERGLLLRERSVLDRAWLTARGARGRDRADGLGLAEGFDYVGTFVVLAPSGSWDELARALVCAVDALGTGVRLGASALARGGVLVRVLSPSAPAWQAAVSAMWAECRHALFRLPPLSLRKL